MDLNVRSPPSPTRSDSSLSYISLTTSICTEDVEIDGVNYVDRSTVSPPTSPTDSRCDSPLSYISVTPSIQTEDLVIDGVKVDVDLDFDTCTESADVSKQKWPKCNYCEKTFASTGNRNKHMKSVHSRPGRVRLEHIEKDPNIYPWVCGERLKNHDGKMVGVCHQSFKELKTLSYHKRKTHYKRNKCEECGKVFGEKTDLRKHGERVHKKKKNYVCPKPDCKKSFFAAQEFIRHSQTCKHKPQTKNRLILPNHNTNKETFRIPLQPPPVSNSELATSRIANIDGAVIIYETPNDPPNLPQTHSRLHGNRQEFDWYSYVAKYKTNRFGLVPLPPGPVPTTIGSELKMQEGKHNWSIQPQKQIIGDNKSVFVDLETYVYKKTE